MHILVVETFRDKKHKSFLFSTKSFPMLKVKIVIFPKIFKRKYSQDIEVVNTALYWVWAGSWKVTLKREGGLDSI